MNINWRDILGQISGYKPLYEAKALELYDARATITDLTSKLTEAKDTIHTLQLICPRPAPTETTPPPTAPTPAPTVPDNTTQGATVNRKIRSQQVIDCPKEKRVVPLHALEAGANHDQLTCRRCPSYNTETCNYVTCKYGA